MNDSTLLTATGLVCATIAYLGYVCLTRADGALLALFLGVIGTFVGIPIGQHLEKKKVK